jgi:hypothetical protein
LVEGWRSTVDAASGISVASGNSADAQRIREPEFGRRRPDPYSIRDPSRSLAKLAKANAKIILGSDTGLEDHLFGMSEQRELESMANAGMSPMQVIVAATSRAAEYLKLDKLGVLAAGKKQLSWCWTPIPSTRSRTRNESPASTSGALRSTATRFGSL